MELVEGPTLANRIAQGPISSTRRGGRVFMTEAREVRPLIASAFTEWNADLSPNGRWLAYESNDTGQFQVYIPTVSGCRPRAAADLERGGSEPHWSPHGEELFYVTGDGALVSVPVGSGPAWSSRPPVTLIKPSDLYLRGNNTSVGRTYNVSRDGKRFVRVKHPSGQAAGTPPSIVVVHNWIEEVKARVPGPAR